MIKSTITAVLLSSVALVPAATIALVATADTVEAKSNNGGGNGGGNDNKGGNSSNSKSKSDDKSASRGGSGGGNSKAKRSGNDPIGNFLKKVTGQDKKKATKTRRAPSSAKVAKAAPEKDAMHPSKLGKMNGALNANTNAIIAHVKNGNTNGPIGGMAALAVAGYAAEGAAGTLELDGKFTELDTALIENGYFDADGNADLEGYLAALEGVPGNDAITLIEDAADEEELADALMAENNGVQNFDSIEDYETWRDGEAGADPIETADGLIAELDGQERPSDEDLEYANERIEGQTAAEDYMLSIWNKGDGDDTVRSEEEDALLDKLYQRIEADGDDLTGAIEEYAELPEPPMDEEEDMTSCTLDEGCEEPTDEDVVAAAE